MANSRKNASDYIYLAIKDEIISGELQFGSQIVELDYAEKLNVSRTPLREAIKKLEMEGIIERAPNGRVKILELSRKRIEEIFKIRTNLENLMLESILENDVDLREIEENLKITRLFVETKNWNEVKKLIKEFNSLLHKISKLEFTIKIIKQYDFIIDRLRMDSLKKTDRICKACEEHEKIIECLKNKDLEGAKEINKTHMNASKNSILEIFIDLK